MTGMSARRSDSSMTCCVPTRRERKRPERIQRRMVSGSRRVRRAASGTVSIVVAYYNIGHRPGAWLPSRTPPPESGHAGAASRAEPTVPRPATRHRDANRPWAVDNPRGRSLSSPNRCAPAAPVPGRHDVGEILGLGVTHYPPLTGHDQDMAGILRTVMRDPGLPERYRDPSGWPEADAAGVRRRRRHGIGRRPPRDAGRALPPRAPAPRRVPAGRGGDLGRRPARELHRRRHPAVLRARVRSHRGEAPRARRAEQRVGRGAGHRVPDPGASRGGQVPRAAPARAGRRRGVRVPAPAPRRPRPRLPEHDHLPRLRPPGFPVPRGARSR